MTGNPSDVRDERREDAASAAVTGLFRSHHLELDNTFQGAGHGYGVRFYRLQAGPQASVTALSGVAASEAGAASGLLTAAHEIGAAVGVAVFSAAGVAVTGGVAAGYRHGFAVAA